MTAKHEIKMLNPLNIDTTAGTQARTTIKNKTIDKYVECMKAGDSFPPLDIYAERGSERYILADGFTRLAAHIKVKKDAPIACNVYEGGIWQAKVHAAGSNHEHGEPRTDKDLHNAIKMLLMDGNSEGFSNQVIADMARCSRPTVAKVREKLIIDGKLEPKNKRTGKDGRTVDVSNIGGKDKTDDAKKGKSKLKDDGKQRAIAPAKTQDEYDREEILSAVKILRTVPCNGREAVHRYNLKSKRDDILTAYLFLEESLDAVGIVDKKLLDIESGDDAAFRGVG